MSVHHSFHKYIMFFFSFLENRIIKQNNITSFINVTDLTAPTLLEEK